MEAFGRKSRAGRSPPINSLPLIQIYKAGHHKAGYHKPNKTALDLQSIITNHSSITASVNSRTEERLPLELAYSEDHVHSQLRSHPEWFLKNGHEKRAAKILAVIDEQLSSGNRVMERPYREYDFNESKKCVSNRLSGLSTSTTSVILRPIEDARADNTSCVYRPASYPPPTTCPPLTGAIRPENSRRQEPPLATVYREDTSDEDTRTEGDSEGSNAVEPLASAVIEVLAPNARLAANVIAHLYKLPANPRSLVCGFITHGNEGSGSSNPIVPRSEEESQYSNVFLNSRQPTKKRRGNQDGDEDPDDQRPKDTRSRSRVYSKAKNSKLKYACHFNIKDPEKYRVRNEIGGTGDYYRSCMGPGWTEPRGLLGHLRDHHRLVQCTRCWEIFDEPEQLTSHKDKLVPRCNLVDGCRDGIDPDKWESVEKALGTPKGEKQEKKSTEKWMDAWDIIFPVNLHPNLRRPPHPYYVDHESVLSPSTSSAETNKRVSIMRAIWYEKYIIATPGTCQEDCWEKVEQAIRQTDAILTKSSQQLFQPTPTAQPFYSGNVSRVIERPDKNEYWQSLFPNIQSPPQPMPEFSPEFSPIKTTPKHLSNSHRQENAMDIVDTGTQFPVQESPTRREAPTLDMPAPDLDPTTTMAFPESGLSNDWNKDCPFCDGEEFCDLCYGLGGLA